MEDEREVLPAHDLLSKAAELLGDVPYSGERYRRWRIAANDLIDLIELALVAPAEPGATEVERDVADVLHRIDTARATVPAGGPTDRVLRHAKGLIRQLAALAASPAPADEGREVADRYCPRPNCGYMKALPSGDRVCERCGLIVPRPAASSAAAVPEERDER